MDPSAEVNEVTENSAEAAHVRRKQGDGQPAREPDDAVAVNALEKAAGISNPPSPETFMETLSDKGMSIFQGSSLGGGMAVEELTLNNYKGGPGLVGAAAGASIKRGFWGGFTKWGSEPRREDVEASRDSLAIGGKDGARSLFTQPIERPPGSLRLEPSYSRVAEHLAQSDQRIASISSGFNKPMVGVQTKVSPASGFSQFFAKSSLRGKGVARKHQGAGMPVGVAHFQGGTTRGSSDTNTHSLEAQNRQEDSRALVGGGGLQLDAQSNELTLREWLTRNCAKLDKHERFNVFKHILKLVDASHSKGLVLQHLCPSFFFISPSNQVRYAGSLVPKSLEQLAFSKQDTDDFMDGHSKRKRFWPHDSVSLSVKRHKVDESLANYMQPTSVIATSSCQHTTSEVSKMEGKWYASPEELNNSACTLFSNIYSLGVLFFELFCYFETREVHSAAMSNLRNRILPPSFLSESPKEAGFCLWLLHPEPSSRPNSRDILFSDLVKEGQDLALPEQSYASFDEDDAEADLLLHFLLNMKDEKEKHAAKLIADVDCLSADIVEVEKRYLARMESLARASGNSCFRGPMHLERTSEVSVSPANEERLMKHRNHLEKAYFSMRSRIEAFENNAAQRPDLDVLKIRDRSSQVLNETDGQGEESTDRLGSLFEGFCKYARYSKFELRGSLRSMEMLNSANVICSLSFDRDEDYFAAAGVSKKIKIFEFCALLNDSVDIHYPLIEMSNRSKLSCVCWNNYIKNYLASTDYEGVVQLWDASTGQGFSQYLGHQKRAWSVDFSLVDPTKLASGSDDYSVKLWSINERNCIDTIRSGANVCCVQFSPYSSHFLAFGSADYKTYCYDLRMTRSPWCALAGHGKTVSYVKFVDSSTIVSASTDNTLKIWDLNKTSSSGFCTNACSMTFSGHTNEKNFVGLSVSDGYIACGSETNEVYAYYKTFPMPITSYKFGCIDPISGQETGDDNSQFVSSVCWRSRSNMVVAANSTGSIKLLQMV